MAKQTSEAIARWAEGQSRPPAKPPADKPAYKRLTDTERVLVLKLAKDGLTQIEIAQRLNRAQSTISDWLNACDDTTVTATRYLRGQSLRMARNIVAKGRAADQVQVLKGFSVIPQDERPQTGPQIVINGFVLAGLGLSPQLDPARGEGAQIQAETVGGSDNEDYVTGTKLLIAQSIADSQQKNSEAQPDSQAEADPGAGIAGDPTPAG